MGGNFSLFRTYTLVKRKSKMTYEQIAIESIRDEFKDDVQAPDDSPVEKVDGGFWVTVRIWCPDTGLASWETE